MLRAFTSILWLFAALAFGFEAVAQPCDLRADMMPAPYQEMLSDMPCHDGMTQPAEAPQDAPSHGDAACCCAALLSNGMTTQAPSIDQPVPGMTLWAAPLPDTGNSIFLEFEPPPPRA